MQQEALKFNCQELSALIKKTGDLSRDFADNFTAVNYSEAFRLRIEINEIIDSYFERADPYKIFLRERFADKYGLDFVGPFSPEGLAVGQKIYEDDQRYFIINRHTGNRTELSKYITELTDFKKGVAWIYNVGDKKYPEGWVMIDGEGRKVTDNAYDGFLGTFQSGERYIATVKKYQTSKPFMTAERTRYYYLDEKGNLLFDEAGFEDAMPFKDIYTWISSGGDGRWRVLRLDGKISKSRHLEGKPDQYYNYSEGISWQKMAYAGYLPIGPDGYHASFDPKETYTEAHPYSCGLARVKDDQRDAYFFIDKKGDTVSDYFSDASNFHEGYAWVKSLVDNDYYMLNMDGNLSPYPVSSKEPRDFSEGVFACQDVRGWIFLNSEWRKPFIANFGKIYEDFHDGLAKVRFWGENSIWYIDHKGERIFYVGEDKKPLWEK